MFGHVKDENDRWERRRASTTRSNRQNPCCWNCSHFRLSKHGDYLCIEEAYYRDGEIYLVPRDGYCGNYIPSSYDSPLRLDD